MAEGKWISDLTATTPLVDAARRVLAVRLQVVGDGLPLALRQWSDDPEHVHQLRVGTRRAGAALAIFGECLPGKIHNTLRKHLRRLRRAAGEARDWDVFSAALAERETHAAAPHRPGLDFLIGYSQGQRVAAQQALESAGAGSPFDFERRVAETLAALRPPPSHPGRQTLSDLAEPWVSDLVSQLHVAAADNLDQYEHLHQVRILGKRLRYGMEIFAGCFDADFKERDYRMIEDMQEILGRANDSHVAEQRLTMLRDVLRATRPAEWKRFRVGIEGLLRYHQRRLPEQRKLFLKWWKQWQEMPLDRQGVGGLLTPPVTS
jgi:CHAD domain-containing protein